MNLLEPNRSELFRPEAVESRRNKSLGDIVIVYPISIWLLTIFAVTSAVLIVAYMCWGTYTRRVTVNGQLNPSTGIARVYAPQSGVVVEKRVVEGQYVAKGEVLYILSSDRRSSAIGDTQEAISAQVRTRHASLDQEKEKTLKMHREEYATLQSKVNSLKAQIFSIEGQFATQKNRVAIAGEAATRYERLFTEQYISRDQLQQKQAEVLDQSLKLNALDRERATLSQDLSAAKNDLAAVPLKQQNQLAQIERSISGTDQELTESEAKRRIIVFSPDNGVATSVIAEVGQLTDATHPLLSVIPKNAVLQAELFAPSKAIGFVKLDDTVLLRYQAYPYQKFGQYRGHIVSVSRTAMTTQELSTISGGIPGIDPTRSQELFYRIVVSLDSQSISTYGRAQKLQTGMVLEADMLQDTRPLYEWILEPIFSLRGRWNT